LGRLRAAGRALTTADQQQFQYNDAGELIVAPGSLQDMELARGGKIWYTIGTAVANVVAIPTTGAHLSLYNAGSNALVIHAVGAIGTTTSAAVGQISVLARNDVPAFNANPSGTLIIAGTTGNVYSGGANAKASVTLGAIGAGNNVAWMPTGASSTNQATSIGTVAHAEVYGRWIVKPTGLFSLATIAYAASGSSQPYIYFSEVPMSLV
jgi:hypothetical protein